jgi:hypothetical protein
MSSLWGQLRPSRMTLQIISLWLLCVSADGSLSGMEVYDGVGFYYV